MACSTHIVPWWGIVYLLSTSSIPEPVWSGRVMEQHDQHSTRGSLSLREEVRAWDVFALCTVTWVYCPGQEQRKHWLRQLRDHANCGYPVNSYVCLRSYKLASDRQDTIFVFGSNYQITDFAAKRRNTVGDTFYVS